MENSAAQEVQDILDDESHIARIASFAVLSQWLDNLQSSSMSRSYVYQGSRLNGEVELNHFAAKQFAIAVDRQSRQPFIVVDQKMMEWLQHIPMHGAYISNNGQKLTIVIGESPESVYGISLLSPMSGNRSGRFHVFEMYYSKELGNSVLPIAGIAFDEYGQPKDDILSWKEVKLSYVPASMTLQGMLKR